MPEKYSEMHLREAKVKKVKEKIFKDIDKQKNRNAKILSSLFFKNVTYNEKPFKHAIQNLFILQSLEDFIRLDYTFMKWAAMDEARDIIIYIVDDEKLDIWLQKDFDFAHKFLFRCKDINPEYIYDFSNLLNENYFAYDFTSFIEIALYKDKKEKVSS